MSIGFPGSVRQDWGLYIRPPIQDPVKKPCPGRLGKGQRLPCHVLYIALWATAKCTENSRCGAADLHLFIIGVMCMRNPSAQRILWSGGWLTTLMLVRAQIHYLGQGNMWGVWHILPAGIRGALNCVTLCRSQNRSENWWSVRLPLPNICHIIHDYVKP